MAQFKIFYEISDSIYFNHFLNIGSKIDHYKIQPIWEIVFGKMSRMPNKMKDTYGTRCMRSFYLQKNVSPNLQSFLVFLYISVFIICEPNFLVPIYHI